MNSPAEIPVIARQSERLGELIEERIVTGAYPPGTRLDEQELATTFGVSRTPVRETPNVVANSCSSSRVPGG